MPQIDEEIKINENGIAEQNFEVVDKPVKFLNFTNMPYLGSTSYSSPLCKMDD